MLPSLGYKPTVPLLWNMGCPESQSFPRLVPAESCNKMQVICRTWLLHKEFTRIRFAKTYSALWLRKGISQKLGNKIFIDKPYTAAIFFSFLILNCPIIKKHHKHKKHCIPQAQVFGQKSTRVTTLTQKKQGILRLEMKPECKENVSWSRTDTAVQASSSKKRWAGCCDHQQQLLTDIFHVGYMSVPDLPQQVGSLSQMQLKEKVCNWIIASKGNSKGSCSSP